jgi:hypothetical protein
MRASVLPIGIMGLLWAGSARGGATFDLVPRGGPDFPPGTPVTMDVFVRQDPGGRLRGLRLAQLDFTRTDPALNLSRQFAFDFSSLSDSTQYFVDPTIPPQRPGVWYAHLVSVAYIGLNYPNRNPLDPFDQAPPDRLPWSHSMLVLPEEDALHVGSFQIVTPTLPGEFLIDVLNSDPRDPVNHGAQIHFGFGVHPQDPRVLWTSNTQRTRADLTGGSGVFTSTEAGSFTYVPVPEPSSLVGLVAGTVLCWAARSRRTMRERKRSRLGAYATEG